MRHLLLWTTNAQKGSFTSLCWITQVIKFLQVGLLPELKQLAQIVTSVALKELSHSLSSQVSPTVLACLLAPLLPVVDGWICQCEGLPDAYREGG